MTLNLSKMLFKLIFLLVLYVEGVLPGSGDSKSAVGLEVSWTSAT